jgi:hypothetical protein
LAGATDLRPGDIFFWGGIAEFPDAAAYRTAVRTTDEGELEAAKLRYCYDLACICRRTFKFLRLAMIAGRSPRKTIRGFERVKVTTST